MNQTCEMDKETDTLKEKPEHKMDEICNSRE